MSQFLPDYIVTYLPDAIQLIYLIATAFFIRGLKLLGSPATARKGNQLAATGMLIGIIVTLFDQQIVSFEWIIVGVLIGSLIGIILAKKVAMTAMPELVAVFNGFGGGASALVAWGELSKFADPAVMEASGLVTTGLSIFIGSLTLTGSFVAFGKLKGFISGNAITFPGLNFINIASMIGVVALIGVFTYDPANQTVFWIILGLSLLIGITSVIPIGGADMPVVISLLNSYSGLAASMAGFVLGNNLLIVSGALVGAAGLILTQIMCKEMNRSLFNVVFGSFGGDSSSGQVSGSDGDKTVRETSATDLAIQVAYASKVVIVPGYGL
ncbi:MAG TPA: NAD synthetase, partial [Balneola sp.]|nr:NAD synthetase [Balneola sp.]